jgi:prepilin-type N-terminal cleavage/methylation domain-containing protein/prepilin-type processing-associated H-X9-DG protein
MSRFLQKRAIRPDRVIRRGMQGKHISRSKGFTLIEVLVVTGIMSVLATLSVGWMYRVHENAKRTVCASNLGQMGKTTLNYFSIKRKMPQFSYAAGTLQADGTFDLYLQANTKETGWEAFDKGILVCPKDENPSLIPVYNRQTKTVEVVETSYAYNPMFLSGGSSYSSLTNMANTPLLMDGFMDVTAGEDADGDGTGKTGKGNNGHGNNEDGVDSSNPGNSKKGKDTNALLDDENKFSQNGGIGSVIWQGNYNPSLPDYGDSFFSLRHDVNPFMGNMVYADGHVKSLDKTPAGFAEQL